MVEGQRVGDEPGAQHFLHAIGLFPVCVGIQRGVLARLDGYLGEGRGRRSGFFHVAAHAESVTGHHVVAADVPLRAVLRGDRYWPARHFLRPKSQGQVVHPRGDSPICLPKGGGPAGARVLYVDNGDAGQAEFAERRLTDRHALVIHVAEVSHRNIPPIDSGVLKGPGHRVQRQGRQVFVRKTPEGMQPHPGNAYFPSLLERAHC